MVSSSITLDGKIVGFRLADKAKKEPQKTNIETLKRPQYLGGGTYKIKPPSSETALYLHLTDIDIDGDIRPYECFISCKDTSHFQWAIALTRVISAVFRKGGEVGFIVDELKDVFDPSNGGYFKKGVYMNSIIADIGYCIESHLFDIGYLKPKGLTKEQKTLIDEKKESLNIEGDNFPNSATVCKKCGVKSVVLMDGCMTCLSCGDSKCN